MKTLILLLSLSSTAAWAKPLVLISYYDAFGKSAFNNSEKVARALELSLNRSSSSVRVKLCPLQTKFDKAYAQVENCLRALGETPTMVLGLGETGCAVKVEMVGRNLDRTTSPDNAGVSRNNTTIIPEAPASLGLTYPLAEMYCALETSDRKALIISNFAGTFVCNNTAFQLSHYYPELATGFIHVPSNKCKNLPTLTSEAVRRLEVMISRVGNMNELSVERLPTDKQQLKELRQTWESKDACKAEFYQRAKGVDEKKSWNIF